VSTVTSLYTPDSPGAGSSGSEPAGTVMTAL
jgi:hypothetical protein